MKPCYLSADDQLITSSCVDLYKSSLCPPSFFPPNSVPAESGVFECKMSPKRIGAATLSKQLKKS